MPSGLPPNAQQTPSRPNPIRKSGNDAGAAKGRRPKPQPYTLEVMSSPARPRAGEPTDLTIVIRNRDTKQAVTDYDIVHEKQMHFMVVSADLQRFAHEHPEAGKDGK